MVNPFSKYGRSAIALPSTGGKTFFVSSDSEILVQLRALFPPDEDGEVRVYSSLAALLATSVPKATRGDKVIISEHHAETIAAAAGIDVSLAGLEIIGLGSGDAKPTFTFSTSTSASFDITGAGVKVRNIIGLAGIDGLTKAFNVTGNGCELDIEWRDGSSTVEAATAVRLDTANDCVLNLVYKGFTAGNAVTSAVKLDDCDNVRINIDAYGVVSTAWVDMVDVASTNVSVRGRMYTSGITNFTRNVVDTITASTWDAVIFDASAGFTVSGGSAAALASDDVTALATNIATIKDNVGGVDSATNVLGADDADNQFASTNVVANADGSILERMEYVQTDLLALPRCVEKADGAVVSGTDDLFTITGGPIKVLEITGIVTTGIEAGTANVKLQLTTTTPAATVDMNAAAVDIDGDVAGTSYQTINTTGIFTPVTAGFVKEANSFATLPTTFLCPIGTIKLNSDAAKTGVIKWYLRYVPLSPNSRVVAAA